MDRRADNGKAWSKWCCERGVILHLHFEISHSISAQEDNSLHFGMTDRLLLDIKRKSDQLSCTNLLLFKSLRGLCNSLDFKMYQNNDQKNFDVSVHHRVHVNKNPYPHIHDQFLSHRPGFSSESSDTDMKLECLTAGRFSKTRFTLYIHRLAFTSLALYY
jgi:hypothetical protein